jgi:hypothetical protein
MACEEMGKGVWRTREFPAKVGPLEGIPAWRAELAWPMLYKKAALSRFGM